MKSFFKHFLLLSGCVLALSPLAVAAVGNLGSALPALTEVGKGAGVSETGTLQSIVGEFINAALTLVGTIFFILMVYAGYLWMTARGKEDQIETAKKVITAAIIGLVLVLSAYAITVFVTKRFESGGSCVVKNSRCGSAAVCGVATREDICLEINRAANLDCCQWQ